MDGWRKISNYCLVAFEVRFCYVPAMTKFEKLRKRFLSKPTDFTFSEIKKLLNSFGYIEIKSGKTAGSRAAFYNDESQHIIRLHKPHPSNRVKRYVLDYLEKELRDMGII